MNANEKYEKGASSRKICLLIIVAIVAFFGVRQLREWRQLDETVVVSESFTKRVLLSEYFPGLKGTMGDTFVYLYDSGVPGGSLLILGGTHPYEPATMLAAYVAMENIQVEKGRVFIIPHTNRSASTLGIVGNAYPMYVNIETSWGKTKYRIGDRNTHPLDQWPDPFTYVHYPSGMNLAYEDMRNLNRCYPGKPNGSLTERIAYGVMELVRNENITLMVDTHEASLMYPVVDTYVAHDRAFNMAAWAKEIINSEPDLFKMNCMSSPQSSKGLTHRDAGDASDALVVLMETPEPFIDRVAGQITEDLMIKGQDQFLQKAADKNLLYSPYSYEEGKSMDYRVGRHLTSIWMLLVTLQDPWFFPDTYESNAVLVTCPGYKEIMANTDSTGIGGIASFLHDPSTADPSRVFNDN